MPKCYQLVGVPGSGKSTWIADQTWALGLTVVSTDAFVEDYARTQGKTYAEVFDQYMPTAVDLMAKVVIDAGTHGHDVIWDQTSTSVQSRARKFRMLPDYQHVAVVFATPEIRELDRRLNNRPGRQVPIHIVWDMIVNFEMPTLDEGFVEIWFT